MHIAGLYSQSGRINYMIIQIERLQYQSESVAYLRRYGDRSPLEIFLLYPLFMKKYFNKYLLITLSKYSIFDYKTDDIVLLIQ